MLCPEKRSSAFNRLSDLMLNNREARKRMKDKPVIGKAEAFVSEGLYPTPPLIAAMLSGWLCEAMPSAEKILEPSAGTGNLMRSVLADMPGVRFHAVEVHEEMASRLAVEFPSSVVTCADFLSLPVGEVDACIMNPPFRNGVDIKHILRALEWVRPGGCVAGLCAAGPRQERALKGIAHRWNVLDAGSFKSEGTGVNVAAFLILK
jgi:predicted RNA methylase